jgi:MFS transporter, OFA family, oxalate/formate antiporter
MLGGAADRLSRRGLLAAAFAGIALMQLWLLAATTAWQLSIFSLVFGACYGGLVALYPAITVDYFGGRNASGIIGVLYTGGAAGSFSVRGWLALLSICLDPTRSRSLSGRRARLLLSLS